MGSFSAVSKPRICFQVNAHFAPFKIKMFKISAIFAHLHRSKRFLEKLATIFANMLDFSKSFVSIVAKVNQILPRFNHMLADF